MKKSTKKRTYKRKNTVGNFKGAEDIFYQSLMDYFVDQGWSHIRLESLPENSSALLYLPKIAESKGYSVQVDQYGVSPGIVLPESDFSYPKVII